MRHTLLQTAFLVGLATAARSAPVTWDGNTDSDGDGVTFDSALNWNTDTLPSASVPDTAIFDGTAAGPLALSYGGGMAGAIGNIGINLNLTGGQTGGVSLDSGLVTGALRVNNVTLDSGSGALTLGDGADVFNLTLGGAGGQIHAWTNNSTNAASIGSDIRFGLGGGGGHALNFTGSGNWNVAAPVAPSNSAQLSIFKTGTGELTLSGGGSLAAGANINGGTIYSAVLKEGTTRITGGAYANNNGEFVVGGLDTVGTNSQLIMDAGSLTGIGWLSVGRGNGTGTVSSDIILNNGSSISSANASFGFNGGNGSTSPKGTITLNGTSSLSVTNTVYVGESSGSNMTLTVNGSAIVNQTSTSAGSIQAGRGAGSTGLIQVAGGTLNSERDLVLGYDGSGKMVIDSGTVNVASGTERWLIVGQRNAGNGELTVNGGNLNLNTNTDLRLSTEGSAAGTNVVNLNGGAITGYVGNQTGGFSGGSVVDLKTSGGAGVNNTFNLNGGTLTIGQVITGSNTGTVAFNFNGGLLRAAAGSANFVDLGGATQTVNVLAGGANIDSNGFNVTVVDSMTGAGALNKQGAGALTLAGAANSLGAASVSAGTLYINGALGTTSGTTVGAAGTIGAGDADGGLITGNLHFEAGATLDVSIGMLTVDPGATVSFGGFDFGDLVGFDVNTAAVGTYTMLGGAFTLDSSNISNYGLANALDLGGGKSAYFEEGSLNVVIVPEPHFALLGGLGVIGLLRRRRS